MIKQIEKATTATQRLTIPFLTSLGGMKWHTKRVIDKSNILTYESVYNTIYCIYTWAIGPFPERLINMGYGDFLWQGQLGVDRGPEGTFFGWRLTSFQLHISFIVIVCIGVSTPLPFFLAKPPLKSANSSSPPFLGNPPLYIGFSWTPPPWKAGFFGEPPKY